MPIQTPFHPRTSAHCTSLRWKEWAGYYAVCSYDTCHEREYQAFRHSAGVVDVTPLFKYEVQGPDAAEFLAHVVVKDVRRLSVGQVAYCCWCDDEGKVVDDGTVTRLDERRFRLTAAEPSWSWLARFARGYRVEIEDSTARIAALSVQGPTSRDVLSELASGDLFGLRFFHGLPAALEAHGGRRIEAWISRTGYTGDLGFEVWVAADDALALWDAVLGAGRRHGAVPAGLDAMDVARVEAGFIMNGVDYWSAHHCLIERRKSTPLELGLGWTVDLDRSPFAGRAALVAEKANGPAKRLVGLELDWDEYEALHALYGLPPSVPAGAWRTPVPLYDDAGRQVGQATSGAWSPILKRNLALASVRADLGRPGTRLQMEVTVEHERRRVSATAVRKPFFDPERKRA